MFRNLNFINSSMGFVLLVFSFAGIVEIGQTVKRLWSLKPQMYARGHLPAIVRFMLADISNCSHVRNARSWIGYIHHSEVAMNVETTGHTTGMNRVVLLIDTVTIFDRVETTEMVVIEGLMLPAITIGTIIPQGVMDIMMTFVDLEGTGGILFIQGNLVRKGGAIEISTHAP